MAQSKFRARKFLEFTVVGIGSGFIVGCLLSLVSGNYFVILGIGTMGTAIGIVLGIIHRNDP